MSREPFDKNKSYKRIEEIGGGKEVTPEYADVTSAGWKRMNTHEELQGEELTKDYDNIPQEPEEREPGFRFPKHR